MANKTSISCRQKDELAELMDGQVGWEGLAGEAETSGSF